MMVLAIMLSYFLSGMFHNIVYTFCIKTSFTVCILRFKNRRMQMAKKILSKKFNYGNSVFN